MLDIENKIITMIEYNISLRKISEILNMNIKDVCKIANNIVKKSGISSEMINRTEGYYVLPKADNQLYGQMLYEIADDQDTFHFVSTSDIHTGNQKSSMKLSDKVYDYSIKNNIDTIFICGDLIEGEYTNVRKCIPTVEEQVDCFIKTYPFDKSIRNYAVFGNHDFNSFYNKKYDVAKKICERRKDIVSLGYGKGIVYFRNDSLLLQHNLSIVDNPIVNDKSYISLVGHGHMMKTKVYDKFCVCLPTLSYSFPNDNRESLPGFVDMLVHLEDDKIKYVELKHMVIINDQIIQASESRCKIKALKIAHNDNH